SHRGPPSVSVLQVAEMPPTDRGYPHRVYMARGRAPGGLEARKDIQMIRRQVLTIGAAALAALLTVTACSSGNQAATSSSMSAGTSAASSSAPAVQGPGPATGH